MHFSYFVVDTFITLSYIDIFKYVYDSVVKQIRNFWIKCF